MELALILVGIVLVVSQGIWWTRHRRLRAAARRSEEELARVSQSLRVAEEQSYAERQTLFNSMVEGVLVLDPADQIVLANRSFELQFQLTTDVRRRRLREVVPLPELLDLIERLHAELRPLELEIETRGTGSRQFELNAAPVLDREGQLAGAVLVFHDITRLRQLEGARREFVANVSHEIRTPLSLIRGYVETLLTGPKDDPQVATRFLQTIERHTLRLSHLIEDILTISRLESGRVQLHQQPTRLRDLCAAIVAELEGKAAAKNTHLENTVPPDLIASVDADRFEQVLVNLLDNAIKYGREGGRVVIEGRPRSAQLVEMCVRDDGPGIPPEARERVFERFYRVDKARSRETGGTGLGLSIVKHLIQSHGGEVWLESELGKGSAFCFTLPSAALVPEKPV